MKTIKVSEATNTQLDWLVAKCEGHKFAGVYGKGAVRFVFGVWTPSKTGGEQEHVFRFELDALYKKLDPDGPLLYQSTRVWEPTTNPAQMEPIIEREGINLSTIHVVGLTNDKWGAFLDDGRDFIESLMGGPSLLIAAARCYVVSKLGEEVEVPEEL